MVRYNPAEIEPKWQAYWETRETFRAPDLPEGEKLYVLDMFPYPSGDGLHVGHPEGYTATDIVCRYARMQGKSVLHPMGFDAFGLPAEEHAIKTNTPPRESTEKNIATFRRQLKMLGFSYDWERELATTDVDYFSWTQWIFLLLFDTWFDADQQRGRPIDELPIPAEIAVEGSAAVRRYQDQQRLAFQADALVNWCPALGTVLANEEVIDGLSERGAHPVQRLPLRQWMLRITAYADRLESELDAVDWPESVKTMQRDWIGRSTGAEVDFFLGDQDALAAWTAARRETGFPQAPGDDVLRVYTTRPDTLYGATYMVIAPEHPLLDRLTSESQQAVVHAYCQQAAAKSDRERLELKEKTGVFTGAQAINPINGEAIPIWVADYVLSSYGTGAIMAVPAHDLRDWEFARAHQLSILKVVEPPSDYQPTKDETALAFSDHGVTTCPFAGTGTAINSGSYDGLATADFRARVIEDLANSGTGQGAVNYKLRDWLFSRQRFWGEPFPIWHELDAAGHPTGMLRAVDTDELPVDLPPLEDYSPPGRPEPPLGKAADDWLYTVVDGQRYVRETNTMPQWAGSCWYYLRFIDPRNTAAFVDSAKEAAWMPVDLYVGGAEHAVLHLLYARFWHKVLYDRGYVSTPEPFQRLVNQGMILGELEFTGYQDADHGWISATQVRRNAERQRVDTQSNQPVQEVSVDEELVVKQKDGFYLRDQPAIRVDSRAHKMSKSRGNVVNPDEVVRDFGADSLRLYEMFMGPLEATKPWSMQGVKGVRSFLDRVWRMLVEDRAETLQLNTAVQDVPPTDEQKRIEHKTIQAVTRDVENMDFNTAIARMMEFVNYFTKEPQRPSSSMESLVLLLAPFAPHIAEELWELLGHDQTLAYEPWPSYDEEWTSDPSIEIPVQINGKLRTRLTVAADATANELENAARAEEKVAAQIADREVVKVICIPGRMVNFVIR
ncbi:MAG: leucine--tRNA ligase [Planctomycetaceae bacterium]|nr:leucine--tRNA ligase [Planctomycetaceae bacterium]